MDKSPLIEMAEELEAGANHMHERTERDNPPGTGPCYTERMYRNRADSLRTAEAVIETTALWLRTGEGSPDAVEASLRDYEAACSGGRNE